MPQARAAAAAARHDQRSRKNAVTKRGMAGSKSAGERTMRISTNSGRSLACEVMHDARAKRVGILPRGDDLQEARGNSGRAPSSNRARRCSSSMAIPVSSTSSRPRLPARSSIPAASRSLGSGVPQGKLTQAGIRRRRRHLADQESAIGAEQRRRGKDVIDARVRKTPIAPGTEAGVIGLEAGAAQRAAFDRVGVEQQHAPVPDAATPAAQVGKISLDLLAPLGGKRP